MELDTVTVIIPIETFHEMYLRVDVKNFPSFLAFSKAYKAPTLLYSLLDSYYIPGSFLSRGSPNADGA